MCFARLPVCSEAFGESVAGWSAVSVHILSKGAFASGGRSGGSESVTSDFRCICGLNSF